MKKTILLVVALIIGAGASSQITDTVSMGAGYANDNYFTLATGNEVLVDKNNWDLAFSGTPLGGAVATIRINEGNGTELYKYSNTVSDWSTVDTAGFSWGATLINSDSNWRAGAFDDFPLANGFDFGWGTYNPVTHVVSGTKVYIIKLSDGSYKKIVIIKLQGGVYSFKYANINGTNELTRTLDIANFVSKNFGYYSIQNDTTIDREPASGSWDFLFTKYITNIGGGVTYAVTGVLSNDGVIIAQKNNVADVNTISPSGPYSSVIGTIGYDWKTFNRVTFTYDITDSLVYFVEDKTGDVYKVIFTGFGGSANGNFIFTREQVGYASVSENNAEAKILNIFPNPSSNMVNVTFIGGNEFTQVSMLDVSGKMVYNNNITKQGLSQEKIDVSDLRKGVYFVSILTEKGKSTKKLIVK